MRKYGKRKRSGGKFRFRKWRRGSGRNKKYLKRLAKALKSFTGETKWVSLVVPDGTQITPGIFNPIIYSNLNPSGDAIGGRIGDKVQMIKTSMEWRIVNNDATAPAAYRIMIVLSKTPGFGPFNINILDYTTFPNALQSSINPSYAPQFKVLYDRKSVLDEKGSGSAIHRGFFHKRLNKEQIFTHYAANSQGVNQLYYVFMTAAATVYIGANLRFSYKDS